MIPVITTTTQLIQTGIESGPTDSSNPFIARYKCKSPAKKKMNEEK